MWLMLLTLSSARVGEAAAVVVACHAEMMKLGRGFRDGGGHHNRADVMSAPHRETPSIEVAGAGFEPATFGL